MNFKTTVILMILLLGVGIYVIIDRTRNNEPVETVSDTSDLAPESRERLEHALSDLEAVKARLDSLLKGS